MDGGRAGTDCDVLVVGAGPTGLTLAAQLHRFGASVRLVDAAAHGVRESRALGIQPRTLEVLRPFGIAEELVHRGNRAMRLRFHAGVRAADVQLFDIGMDDTEYPFLLFLSQAETEAVLEAHLAKAGVSVERDALVASVHQDGGSVICVLRCTDGSRQQLRARYVAGCDGARSTVRQNAGIDFVGGRYPQSFVLADLDATGIDGGMVHAFLAPHGPLLFFPLGHPAAWRVIAVRPPDRSSGATGDPEQVDPDVAVRELRRLVRDVAGPAVGLADPVWSTVFRVHHRHAATYRDDRVFLAGDAAHIHSPAGAQGMNTGIQDAVNLGWKLALVARGAASPELLDTYDAERRRVGAHVLRFTDRAFTVVTSPNPLVRAARTHVVPRLLPVVLRLRAGRGRAWRTVSQLGIRYRHSLASQPSARPRWGPRSGDRLPDAPLVGDGQPTSLHRCIAEPGYHLLLFGLPDEWSHDALTAVRSRCGDLLTVRHVTRTPVEGAVHDAAGLAHRRLRARDGTSVLVRPDGHIGCLGDRHDLSAANGYLSRWLTSGHES